jgi:exodeoxyribonuclease VII small subunit
MAAKDQTPEETLSFEEAITSLEQSVRRLEGNSLGLEQSLEEYAKAVNYIAHCQKRLSTAKRRIEQLKGIARSGEIVTTVWEEETSKPEPPPKKRKSD